MFTNFKKKEASRCFIKAATSGNKKFFLGTDSAPHDISLKENACGCAGVFNTINSIEIITQIFDLNNALENLENFVSTNSSYVYEIPINEDMISLIEKTKYPLKFPESLNKDELKIKIYNPDFPVYWKIKDNI